MEKVEEKVVEATADFPAVPAANLDPIEEARQVKETNYVLAIAVKCPRSNKIQFYLHEQVISAGLQGAVIGLHCTCGCRGKNRAAPGFRVQKQPQGLPGLPQSNGGKLVTLK